MFPEVTWYRVFAGSFRNKEECMGMVDILKGKGLLKIPGKREN